MAIHAHSIIPRKRTGPLSSIPRFSRPIEDLWDTRWARPGIAHSEMNGVVSVLYDDGRMMTFDVKSWTFNAYLPGVLDDDLPPISAEEAAAMIEKATLQ